MTIRVALGYGVSVLGGGNASSLIVTIGDPRGELGEILRQQEKLSRSGGIRQDGSETMILGAVTGASCIGRGDDGPVM